MEMAGLGFVNSATGSFNETQTMMNEKKNGIFAGLMTAVMKELNPGVKTLSDGSDNSQVLPQEFLQFLATNDLMEFEEGYSFYNMIISDVSESQFDRVLKQFGISNEMMDSLIGKWQGEKTVGEDQQDQDELRAMEMILTVMIQTPTKDLVQKFDKSDQDFIKAAKIIELIAKYADTYEHKENTLKALMSELQSKLSSINSPLKESSYQDYLQTRFTRLAADLNQNNQKTNLFPSVLGKEEPLKMDKAENTIGSLAFLPHLTKGEQLTLMLNNTSKPVSAEQFLKQFEDILTRSQFVTNGGTQKLFIKLFPEHLGSIRVEIMQKDNMMMARIVTSSGTAKESLESHIQGLKQAFATQNITLDKVEITTQTEQQRFFNRDSEQQKNQQQRQNEEKKKSDNESSITFEEVFLNSEV